MQQLIKSIKTTFYPIVGKHLKNINFESMEWTLKRILGFEDYVKSDKIIEFIKDKNNKQDFNDCKVLLFEDKQGLHLWMVSSLTNIFIVRDGGDNKLKILLNRLKSNFNYKIIKEQNKPRLYIDDTNTTLPFNTGLTGGTQNFQQELSNFKK